MNEQEKLENLIQILRFPFLGTRESGEPFEYLLLDIHQEKATIAISKWMVNYTLLNLQDTIDLFIPTKLSMEYHFRHNVSATVTSIKEEGLTQEYIYEVLFNRPLSTIFPDNGSLEQFTQNLPTDAALIDLLLKLIKDSLILKQSLIVYLQHFAPFFSRIVDYPFEDYSNLEKLIFFDVINRIKNNAGILEKFYFSLKDKIKNIQDVSALVNLEDLRETMESEISLDLFLIAFTPTSIGNELSQVLNQSRENLNKNYSEKLYINYLLVIKNLERRLYFNYNQIVLIYLKSVSSI